MDHVIAPLAADHARVVTEFAAHLAETLAVPPEAVAVRVPHITIASYEADRAHAIARYGGGSGDTVVAMGTRGRGALGRLTLGSVARTVAHQAACPVLLVPSVG